MQVQYTMPYPIVKLKPQRPERIGHPWVYDNEIAVGPPSGFEPGGIVRIVDSRARTLGLGYANPRSKIALRYLTRRADTDIDDAFWQERIQNAFAYRQSRYADAGQMPPAYRLVHGEADGLPGLIVDVYPGYAVAQFLALGLEPWRDTLVKAIAETLGVAGVYERSDSAVRRLEGLEEQVGVLWGDAPPDRTGVGRETARPSSPTSKTGAKTGLFLDQRENQAAAAKEAAGRDVLNCFAYTGLFGLYAAHGGAKSVTDVEISPAFNALNEHQWAANALDRPPRRRHRERLRLPAHPGIQELPHRHGHPRPARLHQKPRQPRTRHARLPRDQPPRPAGCSAPAACSLLAPVRTI